MTTPTKMQFHVTGMTCGGCVEAVKRLMTRLDPGARIRIDLESGSLNTETAASASAVIAAVSKAGYGIQQV
jgi:copper chaperone